MLIADREEIVMRNRVKFIVLALTLWMALMLLPVSAEAAE